MTDTSEKTMKVKKPRRSKGEGSIIKMTNGKHRVMVWIEGKRITRVFNRESDAINFKTKTIYEAGKGQKPSTTKITLEKYLREWIENIKRSKRPPTHRAYADIVENYLIPNLGKILLSRLTGTDVNDFYKKIEKEFEKKAEEQVKAELKRQDLYPDTPPRKIITRKRTRYYIHQTLHKALNDAIPDLLSINPADIKDKPTLEHTEMLFLSEDQVDEFMSVALKSRLHYLFHIGIFTGMRISELLGLKWSDIDWKTGEITVARQATWIKERGKKRERGFGDVKTVGGLRIVIVDAVALQLLQKLKSEQEIKANRLKRINCQTDPVDQKIPKYTDLGLIFPSKTGYQQDLRNVEREFHRVVNGAIKCGKLPQYLYWLRFHDLRHSAASLMIKRKVPIITVSKILGHSDIRITIQLYGHLLPGMREEYAREMGSVMSKYLSAEEQEDGKE